MTRLRLLTGSALALILLGSVAGAAQAQTAPDYPLPYDARRGVFSFATGLEQSLPAVVQVTTLAQSSGPTSGENDPKPISSGSGVIVDAGQGIIITNNRTIIITCILVEGRSRCWEIMSRCKDVAAIR